DAALADCLLSRCFSRFDPLSLCMARAEHDQSASIAQLSQGVAYQNLLLNLESLKQSAKRMNKSAVLAAIGLEFTLEDCMSSAEDWRTGLYDLLDQIRADVAKAGLRCPPILSLFDCGTQHINDHPILRAQWELTWTGHDHGFYFVAPSYMFHFDGQGRLAQQDLAAVAEMELAALQTLEQEKEWICPIVLLAEREPDPKVIRVRCRATDPLVLDATDPFGVGASCGFSFEGADHDVEITSVTIAPDDPCDVLITCRDAPMGDGLTLRYGFGQDIARNDVDHPSACGSLRDTWRHKTEAGRTLHKWAFPAALPVH
ncbi:MAG: hypothetical protein ACPGRD_10410, partial [Planktomarina sp.]